MSKEMRQLRTMPRFMFTFAMLAWIGVSQAQTFAGGSSSSGQFKGGVLFGSVPSSSSATGSARSSGTRSASSSSSSFTDGMKSSTTLAATSEDGDKNEKVDLLKIALELMEGTEDQPPTIESTIIPTAPKIDVVPDERPRDQSSAPPPTQMADGAEEEVVEALVEAGESVGLVSPTPEAAPEENKRAKRHRKRGDKTADSPLDLQPTDQSDRQPKKPSSTTAKKGDVLPGSAPKTTEITPSKERTDRVHIVRDRVELKDTKVGKENVAYGAFCGMQSAFIVISVCFVMNNFLHG